MRMVELSRVSNTPSTVFRYHARKILEVVVTFCSVLVTYGNSKIPLWLIPHIKSFFYKINNQIMIFLYYFVFLYNKWWLQTDNPYHNNSKPKFNYLVPHTSTTLVPHNEKLNQIQLCGNIGKLSIPWRKTR